MTDTSTTEAALSAAGAKATYGGASASVLGVALSNEVAVFGGLIVGVAGLLVNWFYKYRQDRREQEEHVAQMARDEEEYQAWKRGSEK